MLIEFGDAFDYTGADFARLVPRRRLRAHRGDPAARPRERGGGVQIGSWLRPQRRFRWLARIVRTLPSSNLTTIFLVSEETITPIPKVACSTSVRIPARVSRAARVLARGFAPVRLPHLGLSSSPECFGSRERAVRATTARRGSPEEAESSFPPGRGTVPHRDHPFGRRESRSDIASLSSTRRRPGGALLPDPRPCCEEGHRPLQQRRRPPPIRGPWPDGS